MPTTAVPGAVLVMVGAVWAALTVIVKVWVASGAVPLLVVTVMTIAPGIFHTPMVDGMSQELQDSLGAQVPFPPRLGRPDEYADVVAFVYREEVYPKVVKEFEQANRDARMRKKTESKKRLKRPDSNPQKDTETSEDDGPPETE